MRPELVFFENILFESSCLPAWDHISFYIRVIHLSFPYAVRVKLRVGIGLHFRTEMLI